MASDKKEKKELSLEELHAKFAEVSDSSIDDQAQFFLRSFVTEFSGKYVKSVHTTYVHYSSVHKLYNLGFQWEFLFNLFL